MSDEEANDGDEYVETTTEGLGDQLSSSCGGIIFGILLFFGAFPLLFWNEGRAVARYDTLKFGAANTKSISANSIDPANEGQLVHFSALLDSTGNITDPIFGITTDDIKLQRHVEQFQWKEKMTKTTKKKLGGGKETVKTYTYSKDWSNAVQDATEFKRPTNHSNPGIFEFSGFEVSSNNITVGAFQFPNDMIKAYWYVPLTTVSANNVQDKYRAKVKEDSGGLYYTVETSNNASTSDTSSGPEIGDERITFAVIQPQMISVIAEQKGNTFTTHYTENKKGSIFIIQEGTLDAAAMYSQSASENEAIAWILRFVGFGVMAFGISLLFGPLEALADVIPFLGDIVGCGITFIAVIVAGTFSGITISIAWLIYHPVIGAIVLVVILLVVAGVGYLVKSCKKGDDDDE